MCPPMRAAWLGVAAGLVFVSGCAQKDWIDRTPVTVDVTGVWEGTQAGTGNRIELDLKQKGAKVTGWMTGPPRPGGTGQEAPPIPIVGTVSGDTLSFHEGSGERVPLRCEVQVNGDEMTGSGSRLSTWTIALHRRQ